MQIYSFLFKWKKNCQPNFKKKVSLQFVRTVYVCSNQLVASFEEAKKNRMSQIENELETSRLLRDWYRIHKRELPWRESSDPYIIWISEIILQQTRVAQGMDYFLRFTERFPDVASLASAEEDEVLKYWQGLGYYTRARSLHATAKMIVDRWGGVFPQTRAEVLKLKGIGDYTASSFLALAFNQPETVVDGNVMRIICRLYHYTQPLDEIRDIIKEKAAALTNRQAPADYASAVMDLGATICTPKKPQCLLCPWQNFCKSKSLPDLEASPQRHRLTKREKYGYVYLISNAAGQIFIRKRTEKGLLSGLYEFPWREEKLFAEAEESNIEVSHVFTHFKLILKLCFLSTDVLPDEGIFVNPADFADYPISTLMKKVYSQYKKHQVC